MKPDWAEEFPIAYRGHCYAEQVSRGHVDVCQYVTLACDRYLNDLEVAGGEYQFDLRKAERTCRFIELLPHVKGQWARRRELMVLAPFQSFAVANLFGWVGQDGLRRFREGYLELPRKQGKSQLAGGIGLYMFAADGESGAEVYSGATSEKQALEIFRPARLMAQRTPEFLDNFGVVVGASNLSIPGDASKFEPLIGNPGDGASPNCALIDEYHEHRTATLYDTMITGMGSREQPLALITTTAGNNLAGPCYDKRTQAIKVLEGSIDNPQLFVLIYTLDKDDDWTDPKLLSKSNPNIDVSVSGEFLEARLRDAVTTATRQNVFRTKHHNLWVGAHTAWMDMVAWGKCPPRLTLEELAGRPCFLGVDVASKIDVASLVALFPPAGNDKRWHVHGRHFCPEDTVEGHRGDTHSHFHAWAKAGLITLTSGNIIDLDAIEDDIREFCELFSVSSVGYDPFQATQLATHMLAERIPMVEIPPGWKHLSEPMKQVEALVLNGQIAHGGDPVMQWMISNVVSRVDARENVMPRKEREESKIDGAVALILAMARALQNTQRQTSIYDRENRGFRTL